MRLLKKVMVSILFTKTLLGIIIPIICNTQKKTYCRLFMIISTIFKKKLSNSSLTWDPHPTLPPLPSRWRAEGGRFLHLRRCSFARQHLAAHTQLPQGAQGEAWEVAPVETSGTCILGSMFCIYNTLYIYLAIYRSIDLSIYRSIDLSIYLSIYLIWSNLISPHLI